MCIVECARIVLGVVGGNIRMIDPVNGCDAGEDGESCKKPATIASKDS